MLYASSHIWSYSITITGLIWNYISSPYQRLSHTFGSVGKQFCKTGNINNIASSVSKVVSKNLRISIRCSPAWLSSSDFICLLYTSQPLPFREITYWHCPQGTQPNFLELLGQSTLVWCHSPQHKGAFKFK